MRHAIVAAVLVIGSNITAAWTMQESARRENAGASDRSFRSLETLARDHLLEKRRERGSPLADLPAYAHRNLDAQEKTIIDDLLAVAMDESRPSHQRKTALGLLGNYAHASAIDELVVIIRGRPKETDADVTGAAVQALAKVADKRVMPHLINVLQQPGRAHIGACSLLHRMVGRPAKYKDADMRELLAEPARRRGVARDFEEWWEDNKEMINVRWDAAWIQVRKNPC